jgi:hypothetical protein
MNPLPTPQKKPDFAPQQESMEKDVMQAVKNKGKPEQSPEIVKAKRDLARVIKQVGIDPKKIVEAGQYAEAALKDPNMYQVALQMAVKNGILTEDQLPKEPGIDYKLLANGITAGKLTQELLAEGAI